MRKKISLAWIEVLIAREKVKQWFLLRELKRLSK